MLNALCMKPDGRRYGGSQKGVPCTLPMDYIAKKLQLNFGVYTILDSMEYPLISTAAMCECCYD